MNLQSNFKKLKINLIYRKEQWTLTAWGWGVTSIFSLALIVLLVTHLYPFLAVNSPIDADVLVVEGWLPDYAIKASMTEFKSGQYRQLITTGIPLPIGSYLAEYKTFAELAAATLRALEFEPKYLIAVPAPNVIKHRTYASAIALKQWLATSDLKVSSINLYTLGPHARRSWLIFKNVMAPDIAVGAIASIPLDYDPNTWWKSSEGARTVISESIAYIYARFVDWRE